MLQNIYKNIKYIMFIDREIIPDENEPKIKSTIE